VVQIGRQVIFWRTGLILEEYRILKMDAVSSHETFVPIYQSTRCHQKKATFFIEAVGVEDSNIRKE
jgi:hypothetical protein